MLGDDSKLAKRGYGQITFKVFNSEKILVKDVLHIPSLRKNLLLVRKIIQTRYKFLFQHDICIIQDEVKKVVVEAILEDDIYKLKQIP